MERIDTCLIALRRILRATDTYARDLAQSAGLTAVQFRVLQLIAERGRCTATEISQRCVLFWNLKDCSSNQQRLCPRRRRLPSHGC